MKISTTIALLTSLCAALGQGNLTPTGAPAAGMKTLTQVEPRTPINGATTIVTPGSYYLTTNIMVNSGTVISIMANNVTLDLNGFTISSTANPASGYAIQPISGLFGLTIRNGHIRGGVTNNGSGAYSGPGFNYGIAGTTSSYNGLIENVDVSGVLFDAINVGSSSVRAISCAVRTCGGVGIAAGIVRDSRASDCGSHAIYGGTVENCLGDSTGGGYGINAVNVARGCSGNSAAGIGVTATTVESCRGVAQSDGAGISCTTANNCVGSCTGTGVGIYASMANGCYGFSQSGTAIQTSGAQACYAYSVSGMGLNAGIGVGCIGYSGVTNGYALNLTIGNSCFVAHGISYVGNKYNMP